MIKSYRTKRRKIQEEINLFTINSPSFNNGPLQVTPKSPQKTNNITNVPNEIPSCSSNEVLTQLIPIIDGNIINENNPNLGPNIPTVVSLENPTINLPQHIPLENKLAEWALQCNVPHTTLNKLLNILKEENYPPLMNLPNDSRTLLKTNVTSNSIIENIKPGIYHHFGLEKGIRCALLKYNLENEVQVVIGIDGLPLSKSSSSQLWPILAYVHPHHADIFPIGIYHGNAKPHDSNDYLKSFVKEAKILLTHGIILNDKIFKVSIYSICCDAPARSFVMRVKGHNASSSCTRCFQTGEYLKHRTCFPFAERGFKKRDHIGYVTMAHKNHHINSENVSDLINLPNFDIVQDFPLDYMHLVLLGIVRKLIQLWLLKGPVHVRLSSRQVSAINSLLLTLSIPIEFSRKPRILTEISRWKATELRQFILYTGPLILKNILSEECYDNFLSLSIAMTILLSSKHSDKIEYAGNLLHYFVRSFQNIYGLHFVSYNVHGLLHLVDDYKRFGPLDSCSCFPFENYMKILKSAVRKHHKPLQQIIRRHNEKYLNGDIFVKPANTKFQSKVHTHGPLLETITSGPQLLCLQLNNFTIKPKAPADRYILTDQNEIVQVENIAYLTISKEQIIIGYSFLTKQPYYSEPIISSELDIYVVTELSNVLQYWRVSAIKSKMFLIFVNNNFIAVPIIHTT